jgi:thiol-disulfide isomerase/thioredoxin
MKKYWYVFILCFSLNMAIAQNGVQFIEDKTWEEVLAIAGKENKIVFLDAYTTWCGPCKKMSNEVFPLTQVGNYFNEKFINVKMDMEQEEGKKVARRYGIRAFPTLLFVNSDGDVVHRVAGFRDEKSLLSLGSDANNPTRQMAYMKKKYDEGNREADFLHSYAYARLQAFAGDDYIKVANEYLATQTDWATEKNMQFVFDFVTRTDAQMFDFLVQNRTAFELKFGDLEVDKKIDRLVGTRIDQLLSLKDGEETKMFEEVKTLYTKLDANTAVAQTANFKMTYHRNGGNRKDFALAAIEYIENMPEISAIELSDIAFTFYRVIEDEGQLELALGWAKRALKEEKDVSHYETVASLYYKLGNKGKAKKYAKQGIEYAKSQNEDAKNLSELIEIVDGKKKTDEAS